MITSNVIAMAKKLVDENPSLMIIANEYNGTAAPKLFARRLDKPTRTFVNLLPDQECCELMLSGWLCNIQTECEPIVELIKAVYENCEQMLRNSYEVANLAEDKQLAIRAKPENVLRIQACAALKIRVTEEVVRRLHE